VVVQRFTGAPQVHQPGFAPVTAQAALWFALSYLVGAFPTSLIAGKLVRGIDLREHGSRNLGATNVYRVLGWKVAVPVALVDIAKGAIPVLFFAPRVSSSLSVALLMGVAAILGHVFSVFVGFKGGKGVATGAGVMLALVPKALGISAVVWALLVWLTGYVSVASITGALLLPVSVLLLYPDRRELLWLTVVIALAITWFHRANIKRLMNGTENRFGRRGAPNAGG
jgi:glycerol-3-phosphate acyltransferase PlsY